MKDNMKLNKGVAFVKMHGIGNDYIYIDALKGTFPPYLEESEIPGLAQRISNRHTGVGSDGLILILPSDVADFRMRIFNADGSEAKMCGNGIRCVGKYVYDLGFTDKTQLSIETEAGIRYLYLETEYGEVKSVKVDMGKPAFNRGNIPATGPFEKMLLDETVVCGDKEFKVNGVSMGNPHGVIYIDDLDNFPIEQYGPQLENNPLWPDRANIEFVEIQGPWELKMRVWERGSGETMACGTGACAVAVMTYMKRLGGKETVVHLRGGDLKIYYDETTQRVYMTGPAQFIASGIYYDINKNALGNKEDQGKKDDQG